MDSGEVPVGFGIALMGNTEALNAFAMMTRDQKQMIWDKARNARSKGQMRRIVADIVRQ